MKKLKKENLKSVNGGISGLVKPENDLSGDGGAIYNTRALAESNIDKGGAVYSDGKKASI